MRRLTRPAVPSCLRRFDYRQHTWNDVTPADKDEIWLSLDAMQGRRCAYCEFGIRIPGKVFEHIEHFEQRSKNSRRCFDWDNLFGSCNREESCGKHKDNHAGAYNLSHLIQPDAEDPEAFLVFDASGSVRPKAGLSPSDAQRAQETIRVFNLDLGLSAIRKNEVCGYVQTAEEFAEMAKEFPEHEWRPLLDLEIAKTSTLPFATAIKHVLGVTG